MTRLPTRWHTSSEADYQRLSRRSDIPDVDLLRLHLTNAIAAGVSPLPYWRRARQAPRRATGCHRSQGRPYDDLGAP